MIRDQIVKSENSLQKSQTYSNERWGGSPGEIFISAALVMPRHFVKLKSTSVGLRVRIILFHSEVLFIVFWISFIELGWLSIDAFQKGNFHLVCVLKSGRLSHVREVNMIPVVSDCFWWVTILEKALLVVKLSVLADICHESLRVRVFDFETVSNIYA